MKRKFVKRKWMWLIAIVVILSLTITAFAMGQERENAADPDSMKKTEPDATLGVPQPETKQTEPPATEPQLLLDWSTEKDETPKSKEAYSEEWGYIEWDSFLAYIEKEKETDAAKGIHEIPIYLENSLFFDTAGLYYISRDSSFYEGFGATHNYTGSVLTRYPTSAVRDLKNGMRYLIYATDTGYRLYLHLSDYNNYYTTTGFPIIIGKEMHSYEVFQSLAVGDTIDKVAAIDPIADLIEKEITEVWDLTPVRAHKYVEEGYPVTTVHYLHDGILKIEYDMKEDRTLFITNMVYNENYELVNPNGRTVNYRIEMVDLPASAFPHIGTLPVEAEKETESTENSKAPKSKNPWNPETASFTWKDYLAYIEKEKQTDASKGVQDIPVYIEEELLFKTNRLFYISQCSHFENEYSLPRNSTKTILEYYPTSAIRDRGDGVLYLMYAMDTGKRMYLHLSDRNGYETPDGFPILIGEKVLSYKDFQGLKEGDIIDKVVEIDPIAALISKEVKETLWLGGGLADPGVYHFLEHGYPVSSVHYLKDGILKIEYVTTGTAHDVGKQNPLCIHKIIYNENYELVNPAGRTVNYRIEEIDLPKS